MTGSYAANYIIYPHKLLSTSNKIKSLTAIL